MLRHGAIGTHRAHPCACSEARAQMAQEAPEAKRKPGKKLFGEVRFLWALVLTGAVSGAYRGLRRAACSGWAGGSAAWVGQGSCSRIAACA